MKTLITDGFDGEMPEDVVPMSADVFDTHFQRYLEFHGTDPEKAFAIVMGER